jgi:HD-GYP domain-containing protein (c-di-GMP phosphodiesterase class II)
MAAWKARPVEAALVRVLAVALPVGASVAIAVFLGRVLAWPEPRSLPWWAVLLAGAMATSFVVSRLARRLLPLAMLLKLSLVFPDRTPSRFGVALRAGTVHRLRKETERVRAHGIGDDVDAAVETVLVLATAMNAHDPLTRGHSERVRAFTDLLAEELHLSADDAGRLRWSALLHDCGKLTVHPHVLNKEGPLTDDEWEAVRRHPEEGAKLTLPLRGWLGSWACAVEEHHERWDGTGYPNGLAGEQLSFGARIVAVADAYEVMTAARSYKAPLPTEAARAELAAGAGQQFDPVVVRAFLGISLGRAGWLAGPLGWLGGLVAVRQLVARAPAGTSGAGIAAAAVGVAGVLGLLAPVAPGPARPPSAHIAADAPTPLVVLPAADPIVAAPPPTTAPPAVLGVQFTRPAPAPPVPTTAAPSTLPPASSPPPTTPVVAPVTLAPCAQTANAKSSRAGRKGGAKLHASNNPNCAPHRPG